MLATYRQPHVKPIFGHLPQELYREIYGYDDTYHKVFNTPTFLCELQLNSYKIHYYKLLYKFIEEEVQPRNIMDGVRTEYNISLTPHPANPNVMCFILESTNTTRNPDNIPEEKLHWSGYVCEEGQDMSVKKNMMRHSWYIMMTWTIDVIMIFQRNSHYTLKIVLVMNIVT